MALDSSAKIPANLKGKCGRHVAIKSNSAWTWTDQTIQHDYLQTSQQIVSSSTLDPKVFGQTLPSHRNAPSFKQGFVSLTVLLLCIRKSLRSGIPPFETLQLLWTLGNQAGVQATLQASARRKQCKINSPSFNEIKTGQFCIQIKRNSLWDSSNVKELLLITILPAACCRQRNCSIHSQGQTLYVLKVFLHGWGRVNDACLILQGSTNITPDLKEIFSC